MRGLIMAFMALSLGAEGRGKPHSRVRSHPAKSVSKTTTKTA